MKLVTKTKPISVKELNQMAKKRFGDMVKAVVDLGKIIMVIDADLHADEEEFLLKKNSKQEDLWGINLYPEKKESEWIEFDSMINLRPNQNNFTRNVDNIKTREKIIDLVRNLVQK